MKKFVSLLPAAFLVGLLFFAIFFWMVNYSYKDSVGMGVIVALSGLATTYLKPYLTRKKEHGHLKKFGKRV